MKAPLPLKNAQFSKGKKKKEQTANSWGGKPAPWTQRDALEDNFHFCQTSDGFLFFN